MKKGFSLIDVVISIGIIVLLFGGIYMIYFSILDVVSNLEIRTAATSVLDQHVETIRNMPYENVGTVGGVPAGTIPQVQQVVFGDFDFSVRTTIRNIDDPFDGTLGGSPNDTAPADYKLVEVEVSCSSCVKFVPLVFTTTVSPKSLESASNNGSLFLNVFDAVGAPVSGALMHVVNASVTPSIDLFDGTNASGVLQLVGVPTSSQGYQITASKTGYSEEKTYPVGAPGNPNPTKPHATVAAQTVTQLSFAIDKVSTFNVYTSGPRCEPVPDVNFSISGSKLIGSNPDVIKFSTTSATDVVGLKTFNSLEWDTYSLTLNSSSLDILGTLPLVPVVIAPSSTNDFRFITQPASSRSFLATVKDAQSGAGVSDASVNLAKTGFSSTLVTGRSFLAQTDWSSNQYDSQSGGIDTTNPAGTLKLLMDASSTYNTSTENWLISNTLDFGGATTTFYSLNWSPISEPSQTTLKVQLASNNDNASWSFVGPDGSASSYYTNPSSTVWAGHNGSRYLRYKVYLSTSDPNATPEMRDIAFEFRGVCVPPAQVLFLNLDLGTYDLTVDAPGYLQATSSVSIGGSWQQQEILMNKL